MGLEYSIYVQDPKRRDLDLTKLVTGIHIGTRTKWDELGRTRVSGAALSRNECENVKNQIRQLGLNIIEK